MAEIFVLGASLGGTLMAYELVPQLREGSDYPDRTRAALSLCALQSVGRRRVAQAWRYRDRSHADHADKKVRYLSGR